MKKRSIALLMAAMMAMSMAGCGSSASTEAPASDAAESADSADTANAADADGFYAGKTVEMIVPWAAGGGADTACRLICSYIERELGCTIVINNVTGGGGSIGLAQLTKANTDGLSYAYFANTDSNGDIMLEGVPYTAEDFAPVCKFAADPHIIVTSNASGIKDMDGLIAAGKDGTTLWGIGGAWTHWDFLKLIPWEYVQVDTGVLSLGTSLHNGTARRRLMLCMDGRLFYADRHSRQPDQIMDGLSVPGK